MMQKITTTFFRGLIILLPLLITIWLLFFFYTFLDGILGNIITIFLGHHYPGLGLVLIIGLILFVGSISPMIIGKRLITWGDTQGFNRACLVEYPRHGIWSIGFITSDAASEIEKKAGGHKMVNVFIANTPTPATGFLIMVSSSEVQLLDMKIEEAFKYVISAGVLKPKS